MRMLFTLDAQDYDPNGVAFVRPSARCIVIQNGRVAMLHSLRYDYYVFPGGGIEPGESGEEAMMREAREEAGLVVVREFGCVRRVQKSAYKGSDYFIQDNYYYLCQAEKEIQPQKLDVQEQEKRLVLEFVPPEQALLVNRRQNGGAPVMLEREIGILETLKQEGYFD